MESKIFVFKHKKSGEILEAKLESYEDEFVTSSPVTLTRSGDVIFIVRDRSVIEKIQNQKESEIWLCSSMRSPCIESSLDLSDYEIIELVEK